VKFFKEDEEIKFTLALLTGVFLIGVALRKRGIVALGVGAVLPSGCSDRCQQTDL
jgi:hypothetical protein